MHTIQRGGRPPLSEDGIEDVRFDWRITSTFRQRLREAAKRRGLTVAVWLREAALRQLQEEEATDAG